MSKQSAREQATGKAVLDSRKLKQLYSTMLKCRMIQESVRRILPHRPSGSAGWEAAEVGATIDLLRKDFIAPAARSFVFHFIKGRRLDSLFAGLRTPAPDSSAALRLLHPDPTGEHLSIATFAALSCQHRRKSDVVLAFVPEEPASKNYRHRVLKFASRHKLPIVYVIQNRSSPKPTQNTTKQDYGMPSITVDGNDVVAVYRVAQEAIRRAREGHGPALIHCQDVGSGDPLSFMESYLKRKRLWSDAWKKKTVDAFQRELDKAVAAARRLH